MGFSTLSTIPVCRAVYTSELATMVVAQPRAIRLVRQEAGQIDPALIIGVPVGFVNVVESKERILTLPTPHIVARGRKGGSNVAAAICNALLYQITR